MEKTKKNLEERSKKTIAILKEDLNTVRAGRAESGAFRQGYGGLLRLSDTAQNLANISVPDPRTLLIAPFEPEVDRRDRKGDQCREHRHQSIE